MVEHMLFLDEIKSNSHNPYFCLAGFSISKVDYEEVLIPALNSFKKQHMGDTSVIFHFNEMKKNKNTFGDLIKTSERNDFWTQLYATLKSLPVVVFGCFFDSKKMKALYPGRATSEYDIALHYNIENYVHYLRSINGVGSVVVESRTMRENQKLHNYFYSLESNGTIFFSKKDINRHVSNVGYIIKHDNCAGLQVADFIPSSLIRIENQQRDFYNYGKMWTEKLYGYDNGHQDVLGLKRVI